MPYNYEAAFASASTSQSSRARPSRQATSTGSASRMYPASGPSVAVTAEEEAVQSTRARWAAAQSPTIIAASGRSKTVHFADEVDPSYLQVQDRRRRADSPASQASTTPSLTHSTDYEHDDDKPLFTPENQTRELASETSKSSRSSKSKKTMPPTHLAAHSTIKQIIHELNEHVVSFQHPRDLDFEAPISGGNSTPALSYTAKNRPYLDHIQRLEALQNELDGIDSYGDDDIRKARKEAVVMVERELDGLKRVQARVWSKLAHDQRKQERSHRH